MKKKWVPNNQRGAIAVIFVILLFVLIGFAALGIDAGRWYLAREKLKEAADAAAMAGVQAYGFSASGNCDEWEALAEDVLKENFPDGYLGCQLSDGDIDIAVDDNMKASGQLMVKATACANCTTTFARIFGIDTVRVCASEDYSVAERVPVEIMLVLDRSGSMGGRMPDLRDAAKSFADHFQCAQDVDKMGLITYATGVMVDFPLSNDFIRDNITDIIDNVKIRDSVGDEDTNMEDAIDQADDPVFKPGDEPGDPRVGDTKGFTDQSGFAENERVKQFLVFFTDGKANSFRGIFTQNNIDYDAVIPDPYDTGWYIIHCLRDPYYGTSIGVHFQPTGDGKLAADSACGCENTRWHVFDDPRYPITGYSDPYCNINDRDLQEYVYDAAGESTAPQMAIDHAQELKDKDIIIYCIGLGRVNPVLLKGIASKDEYYYKAPSSTEMKRIFNQVAMEIKKYLYLVK
jgi:uncharacterized protein YegL